MGLRGRLDLTSNVMERRQMILQLHQGSLRFSGRPERAENGAIEPTPRSQPPQREFKEWPVLESTRALQHA